jgi:hypothetical protein
MPVKAGVAPLSCVTSKVLVCLVDSAERGSFTRFRAVAPVFFKVVVIERPVTSSTSEGPTYVLFSEDTPRSRVIPMTYQ